jgi:hypothetical protein
MNLRQFLTLWLPFISLGQAQRKHSPANFLLCISSDSIHSVVEWTLVMLSFNKAFGIIFPNLVRDKITAFCCRAWRSLRDFWMNSLVSAIIRDIGSTTGVPNSKLLMALFAYCARDLPSGWIWPVRFWDLESSWISRGVAEIPRALPTLLISERLWRLSIYIINPGSKPIIDTSYQIQCATKMYWLILAKDMIFSSAYTMTSLSFPKVMGIHR